MNMGLRWCLRVSATSGTDTLPVKFTRYFEMMRIRPDRADIRLDWIRRVMEQPDKETIQSDGRIRRWAAIPEAGGRFLRVILLADGETVHNVFFDRRFKNED